jgi:hypothetical protein
MKRGSQYALSIRGKNSAGAIRFKLTKSSLGVAWSIHMHILGVLLLAGLVGVLVSPAQAQQDAFTTRIETRPIYGAVVTIEHGVRVYRPVPPTTHLIVNPDGVPLMLNVGDPAATSWYRRR